MYSVTQYSLLTPVFVCMVAIGMWWLGSAAICNKNRGTNSHTHTPLCCAGVISYESWKSGLREVFPITEKVPIRASSWLKASHI